MSGFSTLPLPAAQLAVLDQLGYQEMTPIQAASLPLTLAGHDVIARAKTGSGKTAAFALALLARLQPRQFDTQAMVLCPTRELAEQVAQEIRRLARAQDNTKVLTLCGGTPIRGQLDSLSHGAHIVVGTPGRIMDHLQRESLQLGSLATLVLDEADRMLDMGFLDDIAWIAERCPPSRQTMLFSATWPEAVEHLAERFMHQPQRVMLEETHTPGQIRQRFYLISEEERVPAIGKLLRHYRPASTLVFCNTREQCRTLCEQLQQEGFVALALHGELEQQARDQVLIRFANGSASALVATDVAARGLDIAQLDCVINMVLSPDPAVHVHRVGRTGRADQQGWALSLVSETQRRRLEEIARTNHFEPEWHALESLTDDPTPLHPPMRTLQILGGKKDKLRPGDLMGLLAHAASLTCEQVGKIQVLDQVSYIAVRREQAAETLRRIGQGRIKGRSVKARLLT
ncbi:MAG: ATP-dependent RNA helicase DbpA [Candidatus Dactylopiibacterium carminicum]|uniref:ATP-dependent RNA helicase DbpA n=1 Tax=Candidatus Dactylopiibacterium carminicum TaxID=857335 RepID=A0A272EPD8_9RHOO|nr:ATP-dependent RNA helicase DbpA [Candidatus Dactylopiibacterium carminicum]KAF7598252.1 ATP-dependent RNA helicase DbpA [Candidatus Dactylopiibacterium carminicum]PAS91948.1 MAG: ATP-dependent RNA helicase DbpA [Candidatus Dactylopiibacterium carminicum]PAS94989.1 MAG: ATP-dependent RNA helicase DbpA [Candidatus Dactylopiibacterium carminicum]PAS97135.1 MAG: ATP-dependent RNA helicase DbpA [Candidatus Dactylopiibacterium carminicum]